MAFIRIYDLRGKVIKTERIKIRAAELNKRSLRLSKISKGYYVIKVFAGGQHGHF